MAHTDLATRVRMRLILAQAATTGGVSGWGLQNLSETLFGRNAKVQMLNSLVNEMVDQGALLRSKRGDLTPGPSWAEAAAAAAPSDTPICAGDFLSIGDMSRFVGIQPRRIVRDEALSHRLNWTLLEALEQRRRAGDLRRIDTTEGRVLFADQWNEYLDTGVIGARLMSGLGQAIRIQIEECLNYQPFIEEEIPGKLEAINGALIGGFRMATDGPIMSRIFVASDRDTGNQLTICMSGWHPEFWQSEAENDYEPVRVDLGLARPPVLHFDLGDGAGDDPILILSGRSGDKRIMDALYQAHIENGDSWHELNSNEGRIGHAAACYARTGILPLVLGDVFPSPGRHLPSGVLALSVYMEVVDDKTADELEAEGDEDWKAGNVILEHPDMVHTDRINFDGLTICRQSRLIDLLAAEAGISEVAALEIIEQSISDSYGSVYRDESGNTRHVWLAYEPEGDRFAAEVERIDLLPKGGYGRAVGLLSAGELAFDPDRVRVIDLTSPIARHTADDMEP